MTLIKSPVTSHDYVAFVFKVIEGLIHFGSEQCKSMIQEANT